MISVTPSNVDFEICPRRTNLPGPREISHSFHKDSDVPSTQITHMVTQFGQFVDHDIGKEAFTISFTMLVGWVVKNPKFF